MSGRGGWRGAGGGALALVLAAACSAAPGDADGPTGDAPAEPDAPAAVDAPGDDGAPGCSAHAAPPAEAALLGVWVGAESVWVVGEAGAIGRRSLERAGWCWYAPAPGLTLHAVWGRDEDDLWIVGDLGQVLHHDGGRFAAVDVGTSAPLLGVWGSGPRQLFVVGAAGTVRRHDGDAWHPVDLGPAQTLKSVWGASPDDVWVGGTEPAPSPVDPDKHGRAATLDRWQPATGTWTRDATYVMERGAADVAGIHGTALDDVWAVGVYHPSGAAEPYSRAVHRDGLAWAPVSTPEAIHGGRRFSDVLAVGAEVWITAMWGTAVHFDGLSWSEGDPSSLGTLAIDGRAGEIWAVGLGGKVLRWSGTTWVQDR